MASNQRRMSVVVVFAMVVAAAVVSMGASTAAASTFTVTSTSMCGGAGTFQQALADANAHPGPDTIEFAAGLEVEAWTCNTLAPPIHGYPLQATGPVVISGNGATITGGQIYVNSAGRVNDPGSCPAHTAGTQMVANSVGFLEVGTFDADNSGISVVAHDLTFSGMPSLFLVEKNGSLSLTDATADQTLSFNNDCQRPPIQSTDGNVTLTRVLFHGSSTPAVGVNGPTSTTAVVDGLGSGALVMDHVRMYRNFSGRAVIWGGSSADIVSSQFYESGGFELDATTSNVVNTVWRTRYVNAVDRIITFAGIVRTDASTFSWSQPACDQCGAPSLGFASAGTGTFELNSTAVGAGADFPGAQPLLWGNTATGFTSDSHTWIQPTGSQDAAAIHAILPNALTGAPGLNATFVGEDVSDVTPLLGTLPVPGVLIDAVSNSSCSGPNDADKLVNPIDSSCITTDVFGNPRWDAGNDKRTIGAVQNVAAPQLAVTAAGDTTVDLQWNRPTEPGSGTITGYSVFYRPTGAGGFTRVDLLGADTLSHTITDLANGTEYEFEVIATYTNGDGPLSNVVHATPYGPVGSPAVSAVPGPSDVRLFWTEPTTGGHPAPFSYYVVYRPTGTVTWLSGPAQLSARTTDVPDLTCGATYEFGLTAVSADGTPSGAVGTTTAAPAAPCPAPEPTTTITPPTTAITPTTTAIAHPNGTAPEATPTFTG